MRTLKFRIVSIEADGAEHLGCIAHETMESALDTVRYINATAPPSDRTIEIRPVMVFEPNADKGSALTAVRRVAEARIKHATVVGGLIEWEDEGRLFKALRAAVRFMHDVVGVDLAISKRIVVDGIVFDVFPNGTVIAGVTV